MTHKDMCNARRVAATSLRMSVRGDECEDELARFAWAEGVPAPMDADGRLVPLSTETLYTNDGERVTVEEVIFDGTWWYVRCSDTSRLRLLRLHLAQPDSWERLLEDLCRAAGTSGNNVCACSYLTGDASTECGDCKSYKKGRWCTQIMVEDIARRIRELREADEDAD